MQLLFGSPLIKSLGTVELSSLPKRGRDILAQKLAAAGGKTPTRSRATFRTLVNEWQATVLSMYKPSTQKNHRHIATKHLLPRFGERAVSDITRQEVQAYVACLMEAGYAPKTIDHMHDVLSAVLRTAVKWGHLQEDPARVVDLVEGGRFDRWASDRAACVGEKEGAQGSR